LDVEVVAGSDDELVLTLSDVGPEVVADEEAPTGAELVAVTLDVGPLLGTPEAVGDTSLDVGDGLTGPVSWEPQALNAKRGPMNQIRRKNECLMNAPRCQVSRVYRALIDACKLRLPRIRHWVPRNRRDPATAEVSEGSVALVHEFEDRRTRASVADGFPVGAR
jgi:hypothetical protein